MISIKSRIEHFTWANFAYTLAGGGTASMLKNIPYRFNGLDQIGDVLLIYNFAIFMIFNVIMAARFIMYPYTLKRSLKHKLEGPFFPTYLLTWATLLIDTERYGRDHTGEWRVRMLEVLFWLYVGVSAIQGVVQYCYIYLSHKVRMEEIGPQILLLIFPAMLSGVISSNIVASQPRRAAMPMIVAGATLQLMGFNISLCIYAILILKFMTVGLPHPSARPSMFVTVGPLAFTGLSMIGLGSAAENLYTPNYISSTVHAGGTLAVIGFYQGLICWATCLWMFGVSALATLYGAIVHGMSFKLAWCALVFPSAGMSTLTIVLGDKVESAGLMWVGTIMSVVVATIYIFCTICYYWAVFTERIIGPGLDEDAELEPQERDAHYYLSSTAATSSANSTTEKVKEA